MSAGPSHKFDKGRLSETKPPLPLILVFGATGYIGSSLVNDLIARGARVRAVARSVCRMQARGWALTDLVAADALLPDSLIAALQDVDVAYYLVHSMAAGRDFGWRDAIAAENFAHASANAGVRCIVFLGALAPLNPQSEHLTSRLHTGDRLRAGRVPVIEIRTGIIVGSGSAAYEVIRDLVYHLPLMVTPRWVDSKSSPIALPNLIEYLVRVPDIENATGHQYDAAGPDYLSYEQLMRQFGEIVGRRPLILRVPLLSIKLSCYWLSLVTSVPTNIARALVEGLKHDLPADDAALRRLIPQRLLSFKEAVTEALESERGRTVSSRWAARAFEVRQFRHDYAFYAKHASASAETSASKIALWKVIISLGGKTGYFYMDWIWRLRELMDWCVGGPSFSRRRSTNNPLQLGDIIDFWTVVGIEPERQLTLRFGMRAPGAGIVKFDIEPLQADRVRLRITAYWHPQGMWGLLYWAVLVPFHLFIFKGMTNAIALRAESVPIDNA